MVEKNLLISSKEKENTNGTAHFAQHRLHGVCFFLSVFVQYVGSWGMFHLLLCQLCGNEQLKKKE